MFKAKSVISVLTTVLFVFLSNSFSQGKANAGSSDLTIIHKSEVLNFESGLFKLHNSKQTEYKNVTIIEFELGEEANVILTVCDSKGKTIETLIDDNMYSGIYNVNYKSKDEITVGKYTYKLEVKGVSGVKNVFAVK